MTPSNPIRTGKPSWLRRKLPSGTSVRADPVHDRQGSTPHGVPGGQLPQPVRMLLRPHGHLFDSWRHLHPQLPLLQHRGRSTGPCGCRRTPACGRRRSQNEPAVCRRHLGDPGRFRRRRCRPFRRHHRCSAGEDPRRAGGGADPRFSGGPIRPWKPCWQRVPMCSTTTWKLFGAST